MSLNSLAINQQSQYQQSFSQSRAVTFLSEQKVSEKNNELTMIKEIMQESLIHTNSPIEQSLPKNSPLESSIEDDIYHRPLPPKIELMIMVLENFFGKDFKE